MDSVPLHSAEGQVVNPAKEAGLRKGDVILSINNQPVRKSQEVRDFVEEAGRNGAYLRLQVRRGDQCFYTDIKTGPGGGTDRPGPVLLHVPFGPISEEPVVGWGRLPSMTPKQKFAALGHMVVDGGARRPRW